MRDDCGIEMDDGRAREIMVQEQLISRGIADRGVIQAMKEIPRHLFVPSGQQGNAYGDYPLPIGRGQTISQPYIVAYMTEKLSLDVESRVLEIGTGSGYQTAVLSRIAAEIFTVEVVQSLSERAKGILDELGYTNIRYRVGDGYKGWPEEAPYKGIIVTAAADRIPEPLVEQLEIGGIMVIPVGKRAGFQELLKVRRDPDNISVTSLLDVRFVPMTHPGR